MRNIEREAPVLITYAADRDTRSGLVFEFDDLALRRCGVGNEGRKQVACDPDGSAAAHKSIYRFY